MEDAFGRRIFNRQLLKLAIPIGIQQLIFSSLSLIDTLIIGGLGLALLFVSKPITSMYHLTDSVMQNAYLSLLVLACFSCIKGLNMTIIVGILRSGGDTKYLLIIDVAGLWVIGIPLAALAGLVWGFPVYYVYMLALLEEVLKLALGAIRIKSNKWINNVTLYENKD